MITVMVTAVTRTSCVISAFSTRPWGMCGPKVIFFVT